VPEFPENTVGHDAKKLVIFVGDGNGPKTEQRKHGRSLLGRAVRDFTLSWGIMEDSINPDFAYAYTQKLFGVWRWYCSWADQTGQGGLGSV
jgi:hypothetical protein